MSSTLAFVTAHFASDSGGKTRLKRRNGDAYVLLRALNLTDTEEGFDFHLEHHHTVRINPFQLLVPSPLLAIFQPPVLG